MRSFTVELNPDRNVTLEIIGFDPPSPTEQPTPLEHPRPALIIAPGGGYFMLSQRESDPVAVAFARHGFNTFILRYSILEHARGLNPGLDAARAVRYVRAHAAELGVHPDQIGFLGFSAGGHVTGLIGTHWHRPELLDAERAEIEALTARGVTANEGLLDVSPRPDAIVPCYAVLDDSWIPAGDPMADTSMQIDCIAAVTRDTPPAFIWTTGEDEVVPPSQSIRFAAALAEHGVTYEYHQFQRGKHGLSTCDALSTADLTHLPENVSAWVDLAASWLRTTFSQATG